jgi:hypothetical protein
LIVTTRSTQCQINSDNDWRQLNIEDIYYPPQSTIVTQVQTLDVNTANHFSARVEAASSITSENGLDWLDTCTYNASLGTVCTFQSGIFSETPSCVATPFNNAGNDNTTKIVAGQTDNTKVTVEALAGSTRVAVGFHLHCSKQGADFNKSAMIVGNFEQIKSTDLATVEGESNGNQALTADVTPIPFNETEDNKNIWDGTTLTADANAKYLIVGSIRMSTSTDNVIFAWKSTNGGASYTLERPCKGNDANQIQKHFVCLITLNKDDKLQLRSNVSVTLTNALPKFHYVSIHKMPTIEGIIQNLNDSKNIKCSTKYLSANFNTSGGVISDLGFSGLTIGKRYRLKAHNRVTYNNNDTVTLRYEYPVSGTDILAVFNSSFNGQSPSNYSEIDFTASETSIQAKGESINAGNAIMGGQPGGPVDDTRATLCELPDNYIETDEW